MPNELVVQQDTGEMVPYTPPQPTPEDVSAMNRVSNISVAYGTAMGKASTLILTKEESDALQVDFPDDAFKRGAAGKESLIYIEHAYLRDRFNQVLGLGQWSLLRTRPHWGENYNVVDKDSGVMKPAVRVYADCCLLIRGCMVAEAIGDMSYFPDNASMNFGDAAEGAMTQAFRRCAKQFGVGIQAWKKDFCERWTNEHPSTKGGGYKKPYNQQPRREEQDAPPPGQSTPEKKGRIAISFLVHQFETAATLKKIDDGEKWLEEHKDEYTSEERRNLHITASKRRTEIKNNLSVMDPDYEDSTDHAKNLAMLGKNPQPDPHIPTDAELKAMQEQFDKGVEDADTILPF